MKVKDLIAALWLAHPDSNVVVRDIEWLPDIPCTIEHIDGCVGEFTLVVRMCGEYPQTPS